MSLPTINTQRQLRAIKALFENTRVPSFELQTKAGARNVPDLIGSLRRLGWDIPCTRETIRDRDGHKCRPGYYSLTESSRLQASEVIKGKESGLLDVDPLIKKPTS